MDQMLEEWKDVVGFEGFYKVSSLGRVQGPRKMLALHEDKDGYLRVTFFVDSCAVNARINRIVCEAFNGPKPFSEAQALHRDGVNTHNTPDNLYWGTHKQNMEDSHKHRSFPIGEDHHKAKLTWEIIRIIRKAAAEGKTAYRLAKEHKITNKHCLLIIRNEIWKEVT